MAPNKPVAATRDLTQKQRALVDTLVATGCSITEAAGEAGYAEGESGRVTASKTLRFPHVQTYLMQQVAENLGISAARAASRMVQLATNARSEYVQLEASKDILDRTGYKPPDRSQAVVDGDIRVSIDLG